MLCQLILLPTFITKWYTMNYLVVFEIDEQLQVVTIVEKEKLDSAKKVLIVTDKHRWVIEHYNSFGIRFAISKRDQDKTELSDWLSIIIVLKLDLRFEIEIRMKLNFSELWQSSWRLKAWRTLLIKVGNKEGWGGKV